MAEKTCVQRLQKEFRALCKEPVPNIVARPSPDNILEWHYVLEGSKVISFAVHPESWNPMWSVSSILNGLLSFMMDNGPTTGSVNATVAEKQQLAKASLAFNCKNPTFRNLFPEYVEKYNGELAEAKVLPEPAHEEDSILAKSENIDYDNNKRGNLNRVETANNNDRRNNEGQSFPSWLLLLFFLFGHVMALPLLQS